MFDVLYVESADLIVCILHEGVTMSDDSKQVTINNLKRDSGVSGVIIIEGKFDVYGKI